MLKMKPESGTQVGIEPTGLNVNLALEEGTPDVSRNPTSDSSFPDRVRFNWGFHDGTAEAERAKVREMDQHPDRTYAEGYVRGVLAWKNLGSRPETSDEAWSTFQGHPAGRAEGENPEKEIPGPGEYQTYLYDDETESGFIIRNEEDGRFKAEEWRDGDIVENAYGTYTAMKAWTDAESAAHNSWRLEKGYAALPQGNMPIIEPEPRTQVEIETFGPNGISVIGANTAEGKMPENSLTSRKLAEQYSGKGAMPHAIVHQLYQLREAEVKALNLRAVIMESDLRDLDRGGRAVVASMLYSKCDDAARHALLHDEHPHVRSAAAISRADLEQRPEGEPTALSVDI